MSCSSAADTGRISQHITRMSISWRPITPYVSVRYHTPVCKTRVQPECCPCFLRTYSVEIEKKLVWVVRLFFESHLTNTRATTICDGGCFLRAPRRSCRRGNRFDQDCTSMYVLIFAPLSFTRRTKNAADDRTPYINLNIYVTNLKRVQFFPIGQFIHLPVSTKSVYMYVSWESSIVFD